MDTLSTSTIKTARAFSITGAIIFTLLALIGAAGTIMTASGIFIGSLSMQDMICIAAFVFTVICTLILVPCIEKTSLLSKLLENPEFLRDVDDHQKGDHYFFTLWTEQKGYKIEKHMADIKTPKEDQEDLYKSHEEIVKAYLKLTAKTRKAIKAGWLSLWFSANGIAESYTTWHDESWETACEEIQFYLDAYEDVEKHDDIPAKLSQFKLQLLGEFAQEEADEESLISMPADLNSMLKFISLGIEQPKSALHAHQLVQAMHSMDDAADELIESQLEAANASGQASGMANAMMMNAMTNAMHNATHHNK